MTTPHTLFSALTCCLALAACGGGGDDTSAADERASALKGGNGGTTKVTPPTASPLPQVAPEPGVLIHESFGWGSTNLRPVGSKGALSWIPEKPSLSGYWVEYPGSKTLAWQAPDTRHWKWAQVGGYLDPYALHSVLDDLNAGAASSVDGLQPAARPAPTALLPFTPPAQPWSVSMEVTPLALANSYVAIGLTASGITLDNFNTVGQTWLSVRKQSDYYSPVVYEWRRNGSTGPLLATGVLPDEVWNRLVLRVDPVAQTLSAEVNGTRLGSTAWTDVPRYVGFEGVGTADNFVVRTAP